MNNWSALLESLSLVVAWGSIVALFIGTIWRFIKERKYPLCYRMFDYIGCFLFFIGPFLGIVIGRWLKIGGTNSVGLALIFSGLGAICTGVSLKLLPVNCDTKVRRIKDWKICVGIGVFITLYSILFTICAFFDWFD